MSEFTSELLGRLHRAHHDRLDPRLRRAALDAERAQGRAARPPRPPVTPGTATSASTTTRCRAGGRGSSTSRSSSGSSISRSTRGSASYAGALGWTQVKQLEEEDARANAQFGPLYEKFAAQDAKTLAASPEALAVGQKLFLNHCAQCHASDGGGSRGFPNLTDRDWLWGGDPATIKTSITDGRTGVMPPFGPVLGEQGVKDVAHYVMSLSAAPSDSIRVARGKPLFEQSCAACHGADGKGNPALGAPNLTDRIWLYGSGEPAIVETITREAQQPDARAPGLSVGDRRSIS